MVGSLETNKSPDVPYPEYYTLKPYSKSFVQHLDHWYAQSHPDEDFAETFAVWLDPQSMWTTRYLGWPAERKLQYMDRLMRLLSDQRRAQPSADGKRPARAAGLGVPAGGIVRGLPALAGDYHATAAPRSDRA